MWMDIYIEFYLFHYILPIFLYFCIFKNQQILEF